MSRRYYLNQLTASEDAWLAPHEWHACAVDTPSEGGPVTLGFDGSVRDDSTALVCCGLDGRLELLGCWEKPAHADPEWQVDRESVDAAVFRAFEDRDVVAFYCDPPHWQDYVDRWTREFGDRLRVCATQTRPLEWWTNRSRQMVEALARFHDAVVEKRLTYTPDPVLTWHALNARRRVTRSGVTIAKEHPQSDRKIDAAVAAVLAYEARADAIASGVRVEKRKTRKLYRF